MTDFSLFWCSQRVSRIATFFNLKEKYTVDKINGYTMLSAQITFKKATPNELFISCSLFFPVCPTTSKFTFNLFPTCLPRLIKVRYPWNTLFRTSFCFEEFLHLITITRAIGAAAVIVNGNPRMLWRHRNQFVRSGEVQGLAINYLFIIRVDSCQLRGDRSYNFDMWRRERSDFCFSNFLAAEDRRTFRRFWLEWTLYKYIHFERRVSNSTLRE